MIRILENKSKLIPENLETEHYRPIRKPNKIKPNKNYQHLKKFVKFAECGNDKTRCFPKNNQRWMEDKDPCSVVMSSF